ncbi:MAG TPA: zinc ribbon domain-containing protein [Candidatus Pullichristensenella excrementigallinarum]|uniref:Zinc ribbon domain-containing protein n=1 Tax=Candidatus Pullichristensenella excrementigallinarum TaxID=2840907 RepID=A0A9D1IA76_9FIRM|nr:zinc ribbon domain-containing protein [Candidatus Pullichristensenella excrementigallinarum]
MPLYAYKCPSCGHKFEVLRSINERENVVCEKCGEKVEREYQGSVFGTKGHGCSGNCSGCSGCAGGH